MMGIMKHWSKEARIFAFLILISIAVGVMWFLRGVLGPLVLAALFAYVLKPLVDFLVDKTKLKHVGAVGIVYFSALLLLIAILVVLTPVMISQIRALELDFAGLVQLYDEIRISPLEILDKSILPGQFLPEIPDISVDIFTPLAENTLKAVEIITKNFFWVLLIMVAMYYFLRDGGKLRQWVVGLAPEEYQQDAFNLSEQLNQVWSDYLRSQLAFMFVVGLVDALVWLAIGLPGAIILGFLTGLFSFVHEIGAIFSGVLSVLAALIGGSSVMNISNNWFALIVFVLYMILTMIKNVWIRPIIVGKHVHLHSGVVFVIVLAALIFYGALAAFIAVPVFVSLLVMGKYLRRRILRLSPFPEGQNPRMYYFSEVKSEPISEKVK
ncbi:MAG: AI-2E family transporter [Anaerolineae bacterium]|nr:AI-2E family transporter [Anaerolineae bacterium]